uniref:TF-B3 domain-containing protein n=1 Tax=Rhizophora mucronata TaxID=61149 RepID=A0A2P2NYN7_RHIMU
MLPPKFVKKHSDELADVAKITSPDRYIWQVGLTRGENSVWFDGGWPKFVEDHSICHGHVLVFEYGEMSNFNVLIFDTSACEIDYQYNPSRDNEDSCNGKQYSMHDRNQVEDDFVKILSSTSTSSPEGEAGESRNRFTSLSQHNLIFSTLGSDHMSMNKHHKCDSSSEDPRFECDYQMRGKMNGDKPSRNGNQKINPKTLQFYAYHGS